MKKPPLPNAARRERLLGWRERIPRLGPDTVHIDITNTCNLDCVTCWNYAPGLAQPKSTAWKAQRMTAPIFFRLLHEVTVAGAERIIVSGGGEPFTHPDILDFIAAVKAQGLMLTVITNGTLCDFPQLAEYGVDQILLNLSSAGREGYVAYHPNQPEDTFDRLIEGIAALRGKVAVNLVQVINVINAADLVAMVDLAAATGARVSFKVGDTPPGTECCQLDETTRQRLLGSLLPAAAARARETGVRHNLEAFAAQLAGRSAGPPPCFAGYLYARIHVDGRVFFCCEHIDVGHIDHGDFKTLWRAPAWDAVRARLHDGRSYPGCARCGKHDMNFVAARQLVALDVEGDA